MTVAWWRSALETHHRRLQQHLGAFGKPPPERCHRGEPESAKLHSTLECSPDLDEVKEVSFEVPSRSVVVS